MSWNFNSPLVTMVDAATNEADKALWEKEDLGGITEDNHRMPMPVVLLVALTVLTAFAITFPLWGQRPTAAIYAGYVKAMNTPEVMAIQDDEAAMKKIVQMNVGGKYDALLERHPLTMNDLRLIKPEIEALEAKGADLEEYNVVGDHVVMANFEGNLKADGTPERKQPWWDKGYTIDIFYVIYFFTMVIILIKRLPPSTWQPKHH
ncbi:hypothetical protein [Sideroxydans lithotrophicus]|uniref:Uncharacterized protein n=1 Tax=Sideroxydans lithotrophicus (strain ES-1) TaxID=580332 RepID=D5CNV7_SIDLE|nr:hypothetical protein [Sideroxydans lithotrophicus]ADE12878.1 hypothetical protein Slit_2653 [Sideroxydans lithotrophicus ES-1]